jgi:hypothetical protein
MVGTVSLSDHAKILQIPPQLPLYILTMHQVPGSRNGLWLCSASRKGVIFRSDRNIDDASSKDTGLNMSGFHALFTFCHEDFMSYKGASVKSVVSIGRL